MDENLVTTWVRNNGDILEIIHFDPTGKFGDIVPFFPVIGKINDYLDINYKVFDGVIEPPSIDYLKKQVYACIANARYGCETYGVYLPDGTFIKTDRESQSQINSAFNSLVNGFITSTYWKSDSENFNNLNLEQLKTIGSIVAIHVSKCFEIEKNKCDEVKSLMTVEELINYPCNDGWPIIRNPLFIINETENVPIPPIV